MKPYEFMRIYHPSLGKFVCKHKGSGFIVDSIFKPMKKIAFAIAKQVVKPIAKKALTGGTEHVGKKISEKGEDMIMQKLSNKFGNKISSKPAVKPAARSAAKLQESTKMINNRPISGNRLRMG